MGSFAFLGAVQSCLCQIYRHRAQKISEICRGGEGYPQIYILRDVVVAGLGPAIDVFALRSDCETGMRGTSPGSRVL